MNEEHLLPSNSPPCTCMHASGPCSHPHADHMHASGSLSCQHKVRNKAEPCLCVLLRERRAHRVPVALPGSHPVWQDSRTSNSR